jgi:beta-lactamase regulating signal transducer with metallopeptidase domain
MMNVMIAYANSAGDRWAAWIVATSLDAALLLALIGLVWLAIRVRVAPQVGYCLFLLVPLKLLVPVVVTVPAAMAQWTPSALMSSWFKGAHVPERIESQPPVERQIATVGTDKSALSEPRFEPLSQSQPVVADSYQLTFPTEPRSWWQVAPTASVLAHTVTEAPRLSVSATVMIAWLVGVMLLFGRLASTQLRFRARLQHFSPLDESRLAIDMRELCRRAAVPQTIRIVEQDSITAPAVWGIARPTLILPQGIAS